MVIRFEVARRDVYALPSQPTCMHRGFVALSPEYEARAQKSAATQLLKAGVRIATVLNAALAPS